jgi:hypothetical protein
LASNVLIASGRASQTGSPLFVGGPQIGFNYPGLTLEMDLHGPDIHVRGATSAPFPGYMLIGRGPDYTWTLTSPDTDIIDTYAETLCGGSRVRYRYKGKCVAMESVDAGTISKGAESVHVRFRRTVHGPVFGYAKVRGSDKEVALSTRRSSYGRETVDQLFFQQLTFGRVHSATEFIRAAYKTPQTFNAFYASTNETAFVTTGRLPLRPQGVNPDLPVVGDGRYEWTGYLPDAAHPQTINPASGYIVNWNNKPAKGWPASDERWSEQSLQRDLLLEGELARQPKQTLVTVLAAANAAATEDVRIVELWPTLKKMLDRGKAPNAATKRVATASPGTSMCQRTRIPARRDSSTSAGTSGQRGLRRLGSGARGALAQHADDVAQLLQRGVRAGADHRRGLGDLLGGSVGVELERASVQAEQRDAMRQDVVHLAGDAQPLGLAGLLDAQARLGLQALRALAQREHELTLDADEQPPADDEAGDQRPEHHLDQVRLVARVEQREDRGRGQCERGDPENRAARRADGDVEQGQQRRPAGQAGQERGAATEDADRDGVRAAPPQRHEADHAQREVDDNRERAVV